MSLAFMILTIPTWAFFGARAWSPKVREDTIVLRSRWSLPACFLGGWLSFLYEENPTLFRVLVMASFAFVLLGFCSCMARIVVLDLRRIRARRQELVDENQVS